MTTLLVADLVREKEGDLQLTLLGGAKGLRREISVSEINRPGLALSGYLDYFPSERVQIMGLGEHTYLSTFTPAQRKAALHKVFSHSKRLPCIVLTRGIKPHKEVIEVAEALKIPLLRSGLVTAHLIGELTVYLEEKLAPTTTIHGVLMNVYGLGVLLVGDSGIGKSECALELLKRGHMLVADDVVEVKQRLGGVLYGTGAELIRHRPQLLVGLLLQPRLHLGDASDVGAHGFQDPRVLGPEDLLGDVSDQGSFLFGPTKLLRQAPGCKGAGRGQRSALPG